jgi:hypothetical protein
MGSSSSGDSWELLDKFPTEFLKCAIITYKKVNQMYNLGGRLSLMGAIFLVLIVMTCV